MAGKPMWTWPTWGPSQGSSSQVTERVPQQRITEVLIKSQDDREPPSVAGFAFGMPQIHPAFIQRPYGYVDLQKCLSTLSQCHLFHMVVNMSFCHLPPPVKSWMRTCECWRVLICLALTVTEVNICPQTKFTGLDFMLSVSLWSDRGDNG